LTKIDNTEIEYIITNSKIERNTFDSKMDFDVEISAFNLNGISNSIPLVIIEYNLFNEKVNNYFYKDFGNSNSINQTDFYED
jgi:hypothetical protein